MSIDRTRRKVLWLGPELEGFDASEFTNRNLELIVNKGTNHYNLNDVCSIIFYYNSDRPREFKLNVQNHAGDAAQQGVVLYEYRISNANSFADGILKDLKLHNIIETKLAESTPAHKLAQEIAQYQSPLSSNQDLIINTRNKFETDEECLLKIAYGDFESLEIEFLSGGLSAKAFIVHAKHSKSDSKRQIPFVFFTKIDKSDDIVRELNNYHESVSAYIPFYLRPGYVDSRCIRGHKKGIIVGDFVEVSEPLMHVAKRGHAHSAINSLLDVALHKWHIEPSEYTGNLANKINHGLEYSVFNPNPCNAKRKKAINERYIRVKQAGVKLTPEQILDELYSLDPVKFTQVIVHGDLHGYNVMVRNSDAILIDFDSVKFPAPIVTDYASLEIGLIFHVEDKEKIDHKNDTENWRAIVDTLYSLENIKNPSCLLRGTSRREWHWSCVKQIRIRVIAEQLSRHEYVIALIMNLMRRATYPSNCNDIEHVKIDDDRRDYAYILASRLLDGILSDNN